MREVRKLAVVVPVINCLYYTKQMLDSIRVEGYEYKVIVIDNGSVDDTQKHFTQTRTDVIYIRHEVNAGVARSWNEGIKKAIELGYERILVCNNDVIFNSRTIPRLMRRMDKGDVGIVTPINIRGEIEIPDEIENLPDKAVQESEGPDFSCFLISKECFEKVKYGTNENEIGFDENFRKGFFEDNDYHYRIKLFGIKAIATTAAVFYHYGSKTQNQVPGGIVKGYEFEENRNHYIRKWGNSAGYERFTKPFKNN